MRGPRSGQRWRTLSPLSRGTGEGGEVSEGVREALSSPLWQERVGVHE